MLTDQDIERLKLLFVEREEFVDLCIEVGEISLESKEKQNDLADQLDGFVGLLVDVQMDSDLGDKTLKLHARQIQELAEGTGISIPQD